MAGTSGYQSLITSDTKVKVSSILDKSVGKKNLTDGNPETCWTSQQGLPQFIQLVFAEPVCPRRIVLTFQGGFAGTQCAVEVAVSSEEPVWTTWTHIHPEDVNRRQVFELQELEPEGGSGIRCIKLVLEKSSDFFGRITIYELGVQGFSVC
ncbi:galactose-binding like protein [Melanogaster broomeanus]|nr:galactose-binding like protein [Melanogaster broomeanus]